jgi:hypothetical protein
MFRPKIHGLTNGISFNTNDSKINSDSQIIAWH